jgi:hypothetical protein
MARGQFFTFSMEQTALHKFFSTAEERFGRYDTLIAKQSTTIRILSDRISHLEKLPPKPDRHPEFDFRLTEIATAFHRLSSDLSSATKLWESFEDRLRSAREHADAEIASVRLEMDSKIRESLNQIWGSVREIVREEIGEVRGWIESNHRDCEMVHGNLFEALRNHSEEVREMRLRVDQEDVGMRALSSEIKELEGNLAQRAEEQFGILREEIAALKNDRPVIAMGDPDLGLEALQLRLKSDVDPECAPRLPEITKFTKVSQAVDYLYQLVPALEFILVASHRRTNERFAAWEHRDSVLNSIRSDLAELTALIPSLATREELGLMRRRPSAREPRGFGTVKCIACGRELTEDGPSDRHRASSPRIESRVVEEPRPARASQRAFVRRKIQRF